MPSLVSAGGRGGKVRVCTVRPTYVLANVHINYIRGFIAVASIDYIIEYIVACAIDYTTEDTIEYIIEYGIAYAIDHRLYYR